MMQGDVSQRLSLDKAYTAFWELYHLSGIMIQPVKAFKNAQERLAKYIQNMLFQGKSVYEFSLDTDLVRKELERAFGAHQRSIFGFKFV